MLDVGFTCPACDAYLRHGRDKYTHRCLNEGERRYSVEHAIPTEDGGAFLSVLTGANSGDTLQHLRHVARPANYRVTEWIGQHGQRTAEEGETTCGDIWLEENA
jgi:hypothetical protein